MPKQSSKKRGPPRTSTDSNTTSNSSASGASVSAVSNSLDVAQPNKRRRVDPAESDGDSDELGEDAEGVEGADADEDAVGSTGGGKGKGKKRAVATVEPVVGGQPAIGAAPRKSRQQQAAELNMKNGTAALLAALEGNVPTSRMRSDIAYQLNALHVTALHQQNIRLGGSLDALEKLVANSDRLVAIMKDLSL